MRPGDTLGYGGVLTPVGSPAIQEQVDFLHDCGALAVCTSDGNH